MCLRNRSYVRIQYFVKTLNLKSYFRRISIWLQLFNLVSWQSDVQTNSKHTSVWIHIKLMCFYWEEKFFLAQEKREYIDHWTDFLWENKISESYIKNSVYDYAYGNRKTFVKVFNYMPVWEKVYLKLEQSYWYFSLF